MAIAIIAIISIIIMMGMMIVKSLCNLSVLSLSLSTVRMRVRRRQNGFKCDRCLLY